MLKVPTEGGCGCGFVRYAVTAQPLLLTLCHCTTCQKRTGSAFLMSLLVRRSDVSILKGETVVRDLKTGSGSINRHHFCDNCLVRTHTEPAARPGLTFVRPGTLDNPSLFKPSAQIWVRSALKWAVQDGLKCYEQNIDDAPQMIAAWQESNSA
jgi:hypothetical protein